MVATADARKVYMRAEDYRVADRGVRELATISDESLTDVLALASSLCDSYCATELGIARTTERHPWTPSRRVFPNHFPILRVDQLKIWISQKQSASIAAEDIFIVNEWGFVEAVSLASVAYTLTPVLVNLAMTTPVAELVYVHGYGNVVTEELSVLADPNDNTQWQGQHRLWSPTAPVEVFVNSVSQDPGTYDVNYPQGIVIFDAAQNPLDIIEATYAYATPPQRVAQAVATAVTYWLVERKLIRDGMGGLASATIGAYSVSRKAPAWHGMDAQDLVLPAASRSLLSRFQRITLA